MKFFNGRFGLSRSSHSPEHYDGYGALPSQGDISIEFSDTKKDGSTDSSDEDSSSSVDESFAGDYDETDISLLESIYDAMETKEVVQTDHVARRIEHRESKGTLARLGSFDPDEVGAQLLAVSNHSRTRTNSKRLGRAKSFGAGKPETQTLSQSNHSSGRARRSACRTTRRSSVGPGASCKDLMKNIANEEEDVKNTEGRSSLRSRVKGKRRSLKDSLHMRRSDRKLTGSQPADTEEKRKAESSLISDSLRRELELLADSSSSEDEEICQEEQVEPKRRTFRAPSRRRSFVEEESSKEVPKANGKDLKSTKNKAEDSEERSKSLSESGRPSRGRQGSSRGRRGSMGKSVGARETKRSATNETCLLADQIDSIISTMYENESGGPEDIDFVGTRARCVDSKRVSLKKGSTNTKALTVSGHLESTAPSRDVEEASVGGFSRSAQTAPERTLKEEADAPRQARRKSLGAEGASSARQSQRKSLGEEGASSAKKEKRVSSSKSSDDSRKSSSERRTSDKKALSCQSIDNDSAHIYVQHRGEEHTSFLQFNI